MRTTLPALLLAALLSELLVGCDAKVVGILPEPQFAGSDTGDTTDAIKFDVPGPGDTTDAIKFDVPGPGDTTDAIKFDAPGPDEPVTVTRISVHSVSACALLSDGAVRCWGLGEVGAPGHGNTQTIGDDETPASAGDVPLSGPAIQIAVGAAHTCAILEGGGVQCWGHGSDGALGLGDLEHVGDDETPADVGLVDLGEPALQIAAGWNHSCAILTGGRLRCWGLNHVGQLGYGHTDTIGDDETPASAGDVPVGAEVVAVSLGSNTTCARLVGGDLRCWGSNAHGELGLPGIDRAGDDELPSSLPLVDVGGEVLDVAAGGDRTCVLLTDGVVRCFGQNYYAALGNVEAPPACAPDQPCNLDPACCIGDDETPASIPAVDVGADVVALSGAGYGTCALLAGGGVRCWGNNRFGFMGRATTPPGDLCIDKVCSFDSDCCVGDDETPASLGDLSLGEPASAVSAGQADACVLLASGGVRCWGYNDHGELGLGHTQPIGDDELPDAAPLLEIVG